ncbi:ATP-binding cassette domain-containing protein [Solwaraspora sp. WMMA2101]|uniref:ATP-binding cassette domain-containing protein n=1 Tax=Solwaraspora sp. WMMA2101 TaxID=3404124 RepID=UPI003B9246C7
MEPVTIPHHQQDPGVAAPVLDVRKAGKSYPSRKGDVLAVRSIEFAVHAGQFVSVVGPSGCGKTTLMMCIAGLLPISTGEVVFRGGGGGGGGERERPCPAPVTASRSSSRTTAGRCSPG